jgi:Putative Flp pilus-assembly TadE/G-like
MALVALSIVGMLAMAALSIDIGTLYEASAEAQRAADAGALAAARVISMSGITGETSATTGWAAVCGGASSPASLAAINVAQQNVVGGAQVAIANINVYYGTSGGVGTETDCSKEGSAFAVNPVVEVSVQQPKLPTFFARVFALIPNGTFSNSGVSATAAAEAFNPAGSGGGTSSVIPVQPRCVKPLIVPNSDPGNSGRTFVSTSDGSISNQGISQLGGGVIGETFNLTADCQQGAANCEPPSNIINRTPTWSSTPAPGSLQYIPALVQGTPIAIPSCSTANPYQEAIGGCDQTTVYTCGTPKTTSGATQADLTENPVNPSVVGGDTTTAVQCLINRGTGRGEDTLTQNGTNAAFPFQIKAGDENPLVKAGVAKTNDVITSSNSIVTLPIADFGGVPLAGTQPAVTIVGFLQVFINQDPRRGPSPGTPSVTVLNVAGCSNSAAGTPLNGTSPVPIRLITPPVASGS